MWGKLFCKKVSPTPLSKNFIYEDFYYNRTNKKLTSKSIYNRFCSDIFILIISLSEQKLVWGCTITAIILTLFTYLVVPFISTTVCTFVKFRYRTGGIEIPLGIFKGAALKCTFRHFLHEKWCARAA